MTDFLTGCLVVGFVLLGASFALTVVRLLRGPTVSDRVVALDLFGVLAVAFIGLFALWSGHSVFLDAAIALALVAFFGTVAYARLIERRGDEDIPPADRLNPPSGENADAR